MSLGRVALGVLGIGFGVSQLRKAARTPKHHPLSGLSDEFVDTPSGRIRLRTHKIGNLEDRIVHLRKLVEQGKRDPVVYEFARRAVNQKCGGKWCVPEKNTALEAKALFEHIRKHVRYTSDIAGIDSYQKPSHTIRLGTGDCDDYTTLACATATSLGIPCRFKVIRTKDSADWNHIYAELGFPRRAPQKWVPFDASVEMPFGWEAPHRMVAAAKIFHL